MADSPQPKRSNPNHFSKGKRFGKAWPQPPVRGEATERVATRLSPSVKAQFDALPGSTSEKLRRAVELLLVHQQNQPVQNPETNMQSADATDFASIIEENDLLVLAGPQQTSSSMQWQQIIEKERQERIASFIFDASQSSAF